MITTAIEHINTEQYIYPVARDRLSVRLQAARDDIADCTLIWFSRDNTEKKHVAAMTLLLSDERFDYFYGELFCSKVVRYQKYFFRLTDKAGNVGYCCANGVSDAEPSDGFFEYLYVNRGDVFTYPEWAEGAVWYQIFPERFANGDTANDPPETLPWGSAPTEDNYMGGDLKGIEEHIPYLKELGVDAVYINPIFDADYNHKYATTDYYHIDPSFGSDEDFRRLVDALHDAGIRVVLDGVFNHTGIHFFAFADVLQKGRESQYFDWYYIHTDGEIELSAEAYECVGAYPYMPKLNTSNPEVRRYIIEVMRYWIKNYDIDGWRLDVADEVDPAVWSEAALEIKEAHPDSLLLGETWGYGGLLTDGGRLDSVMNYMLRDAVRDYFGYESISAETFDSRINRMLSLYKPATAQVLYNLIDSHDTERFLYYCGGDTEKMKLAVAFQMLFIGAPAIYYGDEAGLSGGNDPDCRRCMPWGGEWDEELTEWYRRLIELRHTHSAIKSGGYRTVSLDSGRDEVIFERFDKNEIVRVHIRKGKRGEKGETKLLLIERTEDGWERKDGKTPEKPQPEPYEVVIMISKKETVK